MANKPSRYYGGEQKKAFSEQMRNQQQKHVIPSVQKTAEPKLGGKGQLEMLSRRKIANLVNARSPKVPQMMSQYADLLKQSGRLELRKGVEITKTLRKIRGPGGDMIPGGSYITLSVTRKPFFGIFGKKTYTLTITESGEVIHK